MGWSKQAEQSLLGSCLLEETAFDTVQEVGIKREDFHAAQHKLIWEAIEHLATLGQDVDVVTVVDRLRDKGVINEAGGIEYVAWLVDATPSADSAKSYAEIVYQWSRKRQVRSAVDTAGAMLDESEPFVDVMDYLADELMRISAGGSKVTSYSAPDLLKQAIQELEDRHDGKKTDYKTGLADLDAALRLEGGRLTLIAGRPGMGKSALANQVMIQCCRDGIPTLMFTMEMPGVEVMNRLICTVGSVHNGFMQNPAKFPNPDEQWPKLAVATQEIKSWPLEVDEKTSASIQHIRSKAKSFLRKHQKYREEGKGLILIDYLGLMAMSDKNRTHAIGEITKGLKAMCGELKVPVIILHQLNRGLESRPDKRPNLSDLRDSGEIEEDVDHAIMLYRDEQYNPDSPDKGIAELIIRKNRTGQNNTAVRVQAQMQYYQFKNLAGGY